MVKKNGFLVLAGVLVVGFYGYLNAAPKWNNQATIVSEDDGDSIRPFAVTVGTITPALVYYSTQTAGPARNGYASPDRIVVIQNIQPFNMYCSTSSTGFSATAGNRFQIFSTTYSGVSSVWQTYSAPNQLWCIYDPLAVGSKPVIGYVGFDSGD